MCTPLNRRLLVVSACCVHICVFEWQVSHLRNLQDFIEAQEAYHRECADQLQELHQDMKRYY